MKPNSKEDFILSAYSFDSQGNGISLDSSDIAATKLNNKKLSWVHLDGKNPNSKEWVSKNASYLDYLIIDSLFADETRPRIVEFEDGILLNLRTANSQKISKDGEMTSIRMWIDESRIISVQRKGFKPVVNLMNDIESGRKIKSSGDFLYGLINDVISLSSANIAAFDSKLDKIDNDIANNKCDEEIKKAISLIRKQVTISKRYMVPQKDVLAHLQTSEYKWFDAWAIRHFQENYNQTCRLIEELSEIKERANISHQELVNLNAERLNKSTFKISLIASIFLPLGFVASLFGMNVGGIPLLNHNSGFYIISYFMIVIFGSLYLVLRNKKNL